MKTHRVILSLAWLVALTAPLPALAGLKIRTNFVGNGLPPSGEVIVGGGDFQEIFSVAAKARERLFRKGNDQWILEIERLGADPISFS
jgi:hypothetical protein